MTLNRYKLGKLIEPCDDRNDDLKYSLKDVKGISIQKVFIETKADMNGVSLKPYKLVKPDEFAYVTVTSRNGEKITLAHNDTKNTYIVSSSYLVFKVKNKNKLLTDYLFMYFNRSEFDRFSRFNSWGSARETFSWEDFCDTEIKLPSIGIQQKYVDVYNAMLANQQSYERGLDELKIVCDVSVENLKKKYPLKSFSEYVERVDDRNSEKLYSNVKNVSVYKKFGKVSAKVDKNNLGNYKIVKPREISFVQTTHNEKVFCNAMNNTNENILVSSVNEVFKCNEVYILPEYLCLNFNRKEFDRYARFHSWGSARETFTWEDLLQVKIPIPPVREQQYIVDIFRVLQERTEIAEKLKKQIKDLCPILIKGSIEEAVKES